VDGTGDDPKRVERPRWWMAHQAAMRFYRSVRNAYVTGCGRSGSKWLTSVLNVHPDCIARHEPLWRYDYANAHLVRTSYRFRQSYLVQRRVMIYMLWQDRGIAERRRTKAWVEVNPILWQVAKFLPKLGGNPILIHLVRDPLATVRSLLHRNLYRKDDDGVVRYKEPEDAPWSENATRLEKVCWLYQHMTDEVEEHAACTVRLEDLTTSWEHWEQLCALLGITPRKKLWEKHRGIRINRGPVQDHPDWDEDRARELLSFHVREYGYEKVTSG